MYLDNQRTEAVETSFRMQFAAREVRRLSWPKWNPLVIGRGDPTTALEADEELTEPRDVPTDLTAGTNVHDMDMRFAGPQG